MVEQLSQNNIDPGYMAGNTTDMDDLYLVGPRKSLGYLPLGTITNICHEDVDAARSLSERNGLSTYQGTPEETHISGGALFVYDEKALGELLEVNKHLLDHYQWPTEPLEFIKKLGEGMVDYKHNRALFTLIAWAFNDPRPEYQRPDRDSKTATLQQPRVPFNV